MSLRASPDMPLGPERKLAQFLHFWMIDFGPVWQWQASGIEDARLGSERIQKSCGFMRQKSAIGRSRSEP